jgi:hypothetical protein
MEILEKVAEVSDGAMLLMAVSSIVIPRVIISTSQAKEKKKEEGPKNDNRQQPEAGQEGKGFEVIRGKDISGVKQNKSNDNQSIKAICQSCIGEY